MLPWSAQRIYCLHMSAFWFTKSGIRNWKTHTKVEVRADDGDSRQFFFCAEPGIGPKSSWVPKGVYWLLNRNDLWVSSPFLSCCSRESLKLIREGGRRLHLRRKACLRQPMFRTSSLSRSLSRPVCIPTTFKFFLMCNPKIIVKRGWIVWSKFIL